MTDDVLFMKEAYQEAIKAFNEGEIPIGAVVVKDSAIIGRGHNRRSADSSPFAHAEMVAMAEAAKNIRSWRFDGCSLYVTLEPCVMCAGALVQCRMKRIVYGARDPKAGAVGSLYEIPSDFRMYHRCGIVSGIMKNECAENLQRFFATKRAQKVKNF